MAVLMTSVGILVLLIITFILAGTEVEATTVETTAGAGVAAVVGTSAADITIAAQIKTASTVKKRFIVSFFLCSLFPLRPLLWMLRVN